MAEAIGLPAVPAGSPASEERALSELAVPSRQAKARCVAS